ncbi:MAG TPA: aminomethyltransferase family protein [Candidatus Limnocylindria bacterium]|nr:aminomethyltransferase family protein [Candidatus Limnocylindria bacterium]
MSVGTALHERTAAHNRKQNWREWSGYLAASAYDDHQLAEYTAIRHAAALIDVSPLYKYIVRGRDAVRLIDRIITRDATKIRPGQVIYTPWCDEHGKVVDDGTIARLDDDSFRWTSAEPHLRWFELNARGLAVQIEDVSEGTAAIALQGPSSRAVLEALTGEDWTDLGYYRRRKATAGRARIDVSRTGYTGDLGYELWVGAGQAVGLWDGLLELGRSFGVRPAGMLALDMVRIEAGLILIEVDYTSSKHALIPEQNYSPYELNLGRLVNLDKEAEFVGRRALLEEVDRGGPARRLVGLQLAWEDVERLHDAQHLPSRAEPTAWRTHVPVYAGGRQVGRATSGTWSPTLKQHICLASVDAAYDWPGSPVHVEWTVEARRGRVGAVVAPLPFFDPPRKRE